MSFVEPQHDTWPTATEIMEVKFVLPHNFKADSTHVQSSQDKWDLYDLSAAVVDQVSLLRTEQQFDSVMVELHSDLHSMFFFFFENILMAL